MESLEIQAKDFLVKWVTAHEHSSMVWQIKPLKRSVNFAIYRKKDVPAAENGGDSGAIGAENSRLNTNLSSSVNGSQTTLDTPPSTPLELPLRERLSLIWLKSMRMRLGLVTSVNNITERRGSIKLKSRLLTLNTSLTNPDLVLVKDYHKLVPGELVKGQIDTDQGGTFAFIVDNTFSKTIGKTVLFSSNVVANANAAASAADDQLPESKLYRFQSVNPVEVAEVADVAEADNLPTEQLRSILRPRSGDLMQGTLLKKRRKKLQGFTKRFFTLNFKHGTLSYFKLNDNKLRGQMPIVESIVSANEKTREIFIDSGMEVWTLKAPSKSDFQVWVEAFNLLKKRSMNSSRPDEGLGSDPAAQATALQSLRGLHLEFADILEDFSATDKDVLQSQLYSLLTRFSNILKIKGSDAASLFSDGEFYDAQDDLDDHGSGVVLVSDTTKKNTGDSDDEDVDTRLSSDLDSDYDDADRPEAAVPTTLKTSSGTGVVDLSPLPIDTPVNRPCDIPVFTHDPPSFLSFVRKNVGKDLSTLSMPVDMNEPITILQKYAEIMEYSEMIDNALQGTYPAESGEMILRIAAFSVTYLSAMRVKLRVGRKPFNPLLGETFELVREDKGFRYLCEKVNHKPPVFAVHVESPDWIFSFSPAPSQKFWGKTSEIYTAGTAKLTIRATQETFTWEQPTCVVKNIIAGEKYTEPCSPITVKSSSGYRAVVEFAKGGMFSGRSEDLEIKAFDSSKKQLSYTVVGKWTELMTLKTHTVEKEIWTAGALLPNFEKKFGFPEFTGTLNKITSIEQDKLPATDSRFRPDMKVYSNGEIENAESLKQQLEEGQRARRKAQEESGTPYVPRYFTHVGGSPDDPCSGHWEYIEGKDSYWERRRAQNWDESHRLW
ncbi:hypothetical protein PUMCH_005188 [Australozyma saopauloensis]|uniref:PH domain-containing protein n=1 Tax=Australozyma saopauloensis TaxID=291208 RepID=A0AAX4HGN8_9ASCO|nr:hypothetical protein PUMCH_005188 [[Candida] saopauloensis]